LGLRVVKHVGTPFPFPPSFSLLNAVKHYGNNLQVWQLSETHRITQEFIGWWHYCCPQ